MLNLTGKFSKIPYNSPHTHVSVTGGGALPIGDITGKIFELFCVMYSSKEISKIVKRMKYETKRESAGIVVVIRNVGNVANVGDREDKE